MHVCECVRASTADAATTKIGISKDSLAVSASIYKLVVIQVAAKRGTRGNLCVNENLHTFKKPKRRDLNPFTQQREKISNQFEFEHHSVHNFSKHNNKILICFDFDK